MLGSLWPARNATVRLSTPFSNIRVIQVCRRAYRLYRTPILSFNRWKWQLTASVVYGRPYLLRKIDPSGCAIASFSVISIAASGMYTIRMSGFPGVSGITHR